MEPWWTVGVNVKWCGHCGKYYPEAAAAKSRQSCPSLCDPIEGSPPGSSIPGILQARVLEWVAIAFSDTILVPQKIKHSITMLFSNFTPGYIPQS